MVDCLPSAITHEHIGESVIPYIMMKSAENNQGLLSVEFHYNRYLYYASDFFSPIKTYDIVSHLIKNSEVYYLKDFLIRNTPKELLFRDAFLLPYHMCFDEKIDTLETSFYSVMVLIEQTLDEVQMHIGQETYLYILSTYNLEQVSLLWLFRILRNILCCALTGFNLDSDELVKQFDDVSVYQYIALPKLKKYSHINEIRRCDDFTQVINTQVVSISHEIRTSNNPIWFDLLINQQIMQGISILSNHILLHEVQIRIILLSARRCKNNDVYNSLSIDNISAFSTDIGKENYIALIILTFTQLKLLSFSLCNFVFAFNNEAIFQQLINPKYSSVIGRN